MPFYPRGGAGGAPGATCRPFERCVSPVNGSDVTGDGSCERPWATIAFALSQIPPHGNSYSVWSDEKWVICLGQGRYTEPGPIIVRQARRCISFQGDGAVIVNTVRFVQDQQADWPDEPAPGFNAALCPAPWGTLSPAPDPLVTFELQGKGGGEQGGRTAENLIFLSTLEFTWASSSGFTSFAMFDRIQLIDGFEVTSTSPVPQSLTLEFNDSSARDSGAFGADNSGAGCTINLKAEGSQLISRIGPFCSILQVQDCRLGSLRRDLAFDGVTPAAGNITSPDASNVPGLTNCAFEPGSVINVGAAAGANILACDSNTLGRLLALTPLTLSLVRFQVVDVPTRRVRSRGVTSPLLLTDAVVLATGGAPGITLTLPNPVQFGRCSLTVKKVDAGAGAVSVAPFGAETIDGAAAAQVLPLVNNAAEFYSDGLNWWITARA